MRLIDADEVLQAIERREKICIPCEDGEVYVSLNSMKTFINNRPTVDAVEHAHWVAKEEMIRHPYARNYYCSWCKFEPLERGNYCPHCGAIMDEEDK